MKPEPAWLTLIATRITEFGSETANDVRLPACRGCLAIVCHPLPSRRWSCTIRPRNDFEAATWVWMRPLPSWRTVIVGRTLTSTLGLLCPVRRCATYAVRIPGLAANEN